MIREVDLVSYLPTFMQNYKETVAALEAENPEFAIIWKATDKVLYNHFISTADEYGISRYEKILGILPFTEDTIENRRSRVQSRWFNNVPYTLQVLLQKLEILCAGTGFQLNYDFTTGYSLTVSTELEKFGKIEELQTIFDTLVPCNIMTVGKNTLNIRSAGDLFFSGGTVLSEIITISDMGD